MSDLDLGEMMQPRYCSVSLSPDRTKMAFTFQPAGEADPLVVILPIEAAVALERRLTENLLRLGTQYGHAGAPVAPVHEPAPA